jgi:hypothetical protein
MAEFVGAGKQYLTVFRIMELLLPLDLLQCWIICMGSLQRWYAAWWTVHTTRLNSLLLPKP